MLTDQEPLPRNNPDPPDPRRFRGDSVHRLPTPKMLPGVGFSNVLEARKSSVTGALTEQQLGDLLFHVMKKRRGGKGRFGQDWEGRASPSAGGLHTISILCIPLENTSPVGVYDPKAHLLRTSGALDRSRKKNAASVKLLSSATSGTTLQFMADADRIAACYENWASLLWRDSGALATTICFVATCLGFSSVVLGRTGDNLLRQANIEGFVGVGGVHLGSIQR